MARDHLAIPATSAALERIFSSGSDLITRKRNQLGRDNIRKLLCMRSWGVLAESRDVEL
jgi:hAT family C-terminal dimerisation region